MKTITEKFVNASLLSIQKNDQPFLNQAESQKILEEIETGFWKHHKRIKQSFKTINCLNTLILDESLYDIE
ncbi:MAG: hypothetical protein HN431_01545 [Bacteroidetes bacterium]|nr:hypothetical protein [Bacteroidota bacterium]